ncbi:MAG: hypothetical protein EXQ94_00530 [Alphaproteobacteria bacterium]|nr:hypothetical protein [Alphaproteobacteria bacterium]
MRHGDKRFGARWIAAGAMMVLAFAWVTAATAADALRVQLDSSTVVRLKKDAGIVIIGNPNIADVSVESPTLVFVFGIRPGETSLTIMDKDGETIYTAPVIVTPSNDRTVTLDRNVGEFTFACDPRCAQTRTPGEDVIKAAKNLGLASSGAASDAGGVAEATASLGGEASSGQLLQPTATAEE